MAHVRCVSYNLWKNEGRFAERLDRMCSELPKLGADIIALQECFCAPELGIDIAATLSEACRLHLTRCQQRAKVRQHDGAMVESRSDLAVLTRIPPDWSRSYPLPSDPADGERSLMVVHLHHLGIPLRIGCTHFTHLSGEAARAVRREQAGLAVALLLGEDGVDAVLMGDLNATARATELAPMMRHSRLHPDAAQYAADSADWDMAGGAIDHILFYPADSADWSMDRKVVCPPDRADAAAGPSDHPAILAQLTLVA